MGAIETLSLAMGSAWTSGINLYATIAALGLAGRYDLIHLPPGIEWVMHPLIIGVACLLYVIEFFADKIPYLDSLWDSFHTFIRIPAGAVLAYGAVGEVSPVLQAAAALAGGVVATAAHGTKMTTRLAINTSPEPVTNWAASVTEDVVALGGIWMIFHYPLVMFVLVIAFTALAFWLIPKMWLLAKRGFGAIRAWFRGKSDMVPVTKPPITTSPTQSTHLH